MIKPATMDEAIKPEKPMAVKTLANRVLALLLFRGKKAHAQEYVPYFGTIALRSINGMLNGDKDFAQLCATSLSALSELEVVCEVREPRTINVCLLLAQPDIVSTVV